MNTLSTLRDILVGDYKVAREAAEPNAPLNTLGIDSLGQLELMFKIEDTFHVKIPGDPPTGLVTVGDVCSYIETLVAGHRVPAQAGTTVREKP